MPSEADLELLRALSEQRVAVVPQAARWLRVSRGTAERRIRRLSEEGLLRRERIFRHGDPALQITARGLKAVGSRQRAPGLKLDEYRHDVGVGWLWTAAREGAFGQLAGIESERAMRAHDMALERMPEAARLLAPDPDLHGVGVGAFSPAGKPERHYPDLLLKTPSGRQVAVELELTNKGPRRLDRVMAAYASDQRIDGVLYVVPDAKLAAKVNGAAERAGLSGIVQVRLLAPGGIAGAPAASAVRDRHKTRSATRATPRGREAERSA